MKASFARLLLVLVVGIATACSPARPPPKPVPAAAKPAGKPAVDAVIHAGTSGDYPPLSHWSDGHPEGFAPALLEAFARSSALEIAWARFTWPELTNDFRAGKFDVASDGITVRPERSVLGRFTVPIARGGAVLLLRRPQWARVPEAASDSPLKALDRPALRVVVNRGGHLERVTRGLFHEATVTAIPDNAGVRAALARGDADAAMTNTFEAPRWAEGLADVERVGPLTRDVTALWVRADREDLAERLDDWLLGIEANGELGRLRARELGPGGGAATALPVDALLAATTERLALMPFVSAAKQRTGKAVEDTAQEERVIAAAIDAVAKAAAKRALPPPPAARTAAFFRAQIEAAKDVQRRRMPDANAPAFSLETDLRPAIARITARMAFLLVRLPPRPDRSDIVAKTRRELAETGVDDEHVQALASALASLRDE